MRRIIHFLINISIVSLICLLITNYSSYQLTYRNQDINHIYLSFIIFFYVFYLMCYNKILLNEFSYKKSKFLALLRRTVLFLGGISSIFLNIRILLMEQQYSEDAHLKLGLKLSKKDTSDKLLEHAYSYCSNKNYTSLLDEVTLRTLASKVNNEADLENLIDGYDVAYRGFLKAHDVVTQFQQLQEASKIPDIADKINDLKLEALNTILTLQSVDILKPDVYDMFVLTFTVMPRRAFYDYDPVAIMALLSVAWCIYLFYKQLPGVPYNFNINDKVREYFQQDYPNVGDGSIYWRMVSDCYRSLVDTSNEFRKMVESLDGPLDPIAIKELQLKAAAKNITRILYLLEAEMEEDEVFNLLYFIESFYDPETDGTLKVCKWLIY